MLMRKPFLICSFLFLFLLGGCVSLQVGREVQSGRTALMLGNPDAAVPHFEAASRLDPDYITGFTLLDVGIWTYLGRAYYEAGQKEKALESLKKAKARHSEDYFARIYLGLVMSQNAQRREGTAELDAGLEGLGVWLDTLPSRTQDGKYWDPGGHLRRAIVATRGLLQAERINVARVDENVRWLGKNFDEEIDEVRREGPDPQATLEIGN